MPGGAGTGVNPPFYSAVVSGPCRPPGPVVSGLSRVRMLGCAFTWSHVLPLGGRGHERPPRSVLRCRGGRAGHGVPWVGLHMVGCSQSEILAEELSRRGGLELICPQPRGSVLRAGQALVWGEGSPLHVSRAAGIPAGFAPWIQP